jgi:hypothetical protein
MLCGIWSCGYGILALDGTVNSQNGIMKLEIKNATKRSHLTPKVNWCIATPHFQLKTCLFISLCILRDLPKQKIPSELCCGGDPAIFLSSHVPMERISDDMDLENFKTQGGKGQIRKFKKQEFSNFH